MEVPHARIDFHLHSEASNVTDYYAANALALPESYSDPFKLYRMLRARGMDLITLTDPTPSTACGACSTLACPTFSSVPR